MTSKIEFVEKASAAGANVSALCREYGISRETGHKWLKRFREAGYDGLDDRSRRPKSSPIATGEELVLAVLEARQAHPRWGPKKLVEVVRRRCGATPSVATIGRILKRFGQIRQRRRKAVLSVVTHAPHVHAGAPNEVWSVDFKGWWRTRDGSRCEPLTVRDAYSRFVLCARRMEARNLEAVREEFERLFRRYGVPGAIQCDNGEPFVSVQSRAGLTRLSAWWVSLGIRMLRSRPACPQDNGGHERMHREIAADVEAYPQLDLSAEQRALDRWRQQFNCVRPHEALGGKTPNDLYRRGPKRSLRPARPSYPSHWITLRAHGPHGMISYFGQSLSIGRAFIGHTVALERTADGRANLWFYDVPAGELQLPPAIHTIDRACLDFVDRNVARRHSKSTKT